MGTEVQVKFIGIACTKVGGEAGNDLEIYGYVAAVPAELTEFGELVEVGDRILFFNEDSSHFVSICENVVYPGKAPTAKIAFEEGQYLKLVGHLWDKDDGFWNPNDDMGYKFNLYNPEVIGLGAHTLKFQEGDQKAEARFTLLKLGD